MFSGMGGLLRAGVLIRGGYVAPKSHAVFFRIGVFYAVFTACKDESGLIRIKNICTYIHTDTYTNVYTHTQTKLPTLVPTTQHPSIQYKTLAPFRKRKVGLPPSPLTSSGSAGAGTWLSVEGLGCGHLTQSPPPKKVSKLT
jgi:hypothetical protein